MNHPDDLLAPYVDGALPTAERNAVDRHLATCARCRREVELAGGASRALRALPPVQPPADLLGPAIEAAERNTAERAPEVAPLRPEARPRWIGWAAAAVSVAAVLVLGVTVLPRVGTGSSEAALPASNGAAGVSVPAATRVEVQDVDYDVASVQRLADQLAAATSGTRVPEAAVATGAAAAEVTFGPISTFPTASACLTQAFGQEPGKLVRVIQARFRGVPAYLGVYLVGPGAGQPADTGVVLIAAKEHCTILHSTTIRL
ncbi:MAG TPA: zf-HC2 domain-containing protein [Actinomycetota bacterium]|nr:zf-HC2 domain-containing protein [Actinomycetota bacterium]